MYKFESWQSFTATWAFNCISVKGDPEISKSKTCMWFLHMTWLNNRNHWIGFMHVSAASARFTTSEWRKGTCKGHLKRKHRSCSTSLFCFSGMYIYINMFLFWIQRNHISTTTSLQKLWLSIVLATYNVSEWRDTLTTNWMHWIEWR